jgi:signal recognition particle subunit SRP54
MFEKLTERLSQAFKKLSGSGVLNETHVDEALKEIRRSLLEADVHYKVAKNICDRVKEKAIGQKVWQTLTPGQQVVKIFHDELIEALGGKEQKIPNFAGQPPVVVLICGLQGSGKTTFTAKLALYLKKKLKKSVGILPADCARPAAKEQLLVLAKQCEIPAFDSPIAKGALAVTQLGLEWAKKEFFDVLLIDTAGRLQVDEALMQELSEIEKITNPKEKFLVVDSMIGSQGLEVAKTFHERVQLTGLVLSKLDGDSRGGIALSAREVTSLPIVFASVGEKIQDLEVFYPDRMASRISGMGDVMSLIEKAQEKISADDALEQTTKMLSGEFTLVDFKNQLKMIQSLGPLEGIFKMLPGMGGAIDQLKAADAEKELKKIEAIINSMTKEERLNPDILNGSRRLRIAKGSGTEVSDINRFMKQFIEMQRMMKQFSKMGMAGKLKKLALSQVLGKKTF